MQARAVHEAARICVTALHPSSEQPMSEKITLVTVSGAPLILQRGVLELAPDQAAPRAHALRPVGKVSAGERGLFEIRGEVHFKAGERVGFVGDIPKALLGAVQPVRRAVPRAAA